MVGQSPFLWPFQLEPFLPYMNLALKNFLPDRNLALKHHYRTYITQAEHLLWSCCVFSNIATERIKQFVLQKLDNIPSFFKIQIIFLLNFWAKVLTIFQPYIESYKVLQSLTGLYKVIQSHERPYRFMQWYGKMSKTSRGRICIKYTCAL